MNFVLLDVAIGLVMVFALVALMCAGLQEMLASAMNLRGKTLWEGVQSILIADYGPEGKLSKTDPGAVVAAGMQAHPLIVGMVPDRFVGADFFRWMWGSRQPTADIGSAKPSYLQAQTFASVLADVIGTTYEGGAMRYADFPRAVAAMPDGRLKEVLQGFIVEAKGDAEQTRLAVEAWYDEAMQRVGGWYKRRTQVLLLTIGFVAAVSMNIDAIFIAQTLWEQPLLREAVVAQAVELNKAKTDTSADGKAKVEQARKELAALPASLPMGWPLAQWKEGEGFLLNLGRFMLLLAGWTITAGAVSFGAPFWFDLLAKLVPLRSSGGKPAPAPTSAGAQRPTSHERANTPREPIERPLTLGAAEPFRGALNDYEAGSLDEATILEVKRRLRLVGPSATSAFLDQVTRDAIKEKQREMNWPASGELSARFVAELTGATATTGQERPI